MPFSSEAILVVDDDEFQLDLMALQLANLGFTEVLVATDGQQALAQFDLHRTRINLIISDLSMPDMDGLVMMRHLASRGFGGGMILLSGMHDEILSSAGGLAQAHGLRILGCLSKPCDPQQLAQLLESYRPPTNRTNPAELTQALAPQRLQAALANGEIIPWYQPKLNLLTGQPVGAEALARWPQADGSFISPAIFVPAMEAAGLADELFFVMARQVAAEMQQWQQQDISLKVAINLSMDTALNLAMPERLGEIVNAADLSPANFVIEVTESRLMVRRSLAMESLTRLSLMGFTLSIDDFGTGYSSLVQLIDLPFQELKIDGGFVQRADAERKAQAIVHIAVMLGQQLGMHVVAEGVETAEQLEMIRASGGQSVQGYFYARPMPMNDFTLWLQTQPTA